MTVLLNLKSISFMGNRSLFFITQYVFMRWRRSIGARERLWSVCAYAQAGLSLWWSHIPQISQRICTVWSESTLWVWRITKTWLLRKRLVKALISLRRCGVRSESSMSWIPAHIVSSRHLPSVHITFDTFLEPGLIPVFGQSWLPQHPWFLIYYDKF